jgi:outer membrane protein OmpA-like peptidoglycan-associated protein
MIRIAFLTSALFASTAAFAAPEDLDTDCALYNECASAVPEEATTSGDAAVEDGPKRAVRTSTNVRGGFTMRREPVAATVPTRPNTVAVKPKATGQKAALSTARAKAAPGATQRTEALRVAQQITFVTGSATLQPSAKQVADRLALSMLRPDKLSERFRIEGHTDAVGSRESNLALSKRRAQAVADYLGTLGVDAKRLEVVGYGFDRPIEGVAKTSAANRRVVATVVR